MTAKSPIVPLGVLLAIVSYAVYSWGDAIIKSLGETVGMYEIGLFCTAFSLLPALFAKPKDEAWRDTFKFRHPWWMQLIAALRVTSGVAITYSFITIPLAEAYCLVFLIPVFITILSVVVLKEDVGIERWALVLVSFAGVLLVVRPGFRELELGHLTALVCAIAAAIATTTTRFISGNERKISLFMLPTVYTLLFNGLMLVILGFKMPTGLEFGVMLICGLLGGIGYLLQITAISITPASRIAPMQYTQIVWALIAGAFFFAEIPDSLAMVGLGVVVVSGIIGIFSDGARARIAGRFAEYRARRAGGQPEPPPIPGPPEV
jgi:drug/metabolite transporter (DMT)-like permease